MAKVIKLEGESAADRRARIYNRERLKEEASMGLCRLIDERDGMNRTEFANRIGRSKSFVTKILDTHNFTLDTLSDVYSSLGYIVHLTLTPREFEGLREPTIESATPVAQPMPSLLPSSVPHVEWMYRSTVARDPEQASEAFTFVGPKDHSYGYQEFQLRRNATGTSEGTGLASQMGT